MSSAWRAPAGGSPPLARAIHIWRVDLDADWTAATELTADERTRATRIRSAERGRRWGSSRLALRSILAGYTGLDPTEIELTSGAHGKPRLRGPGPEFNLSHADSLALIAVCEAPVGVDLERRDPRRDLVALAEHGLGRDAAERVRAAPAEERPALFYAAWCRHEARAKCGGGGLAGPPPTGPVAVADLDPGPGWAAAVAVEGAERPILMLRALPPAPLSGGGAAR